MTLAKPGRSGLNTRISWAGPQKVTTAASRTTWACSPAISDPGDLSGQNGSIQAAALHPPLILPGLTGIVDHDQGQLVGDDRHASPTVLSPVGL